MRGQNLLYISLAITAVFSAVGAALDSPVNTNPLGLGTVPPSAYKSGLIPSINPVDTSGNNVVTGNVAGGMQFRGVVPYRGTTDFSGSLSRGSAEMDSFLRNTASSQDFGRPAGGITPYYSPNWTVTTTTPAGNVVATPQTTGSYGMQPSSGAGLPAGQMSYYRVGYTPPMSNRPLSMNREELEKAINVDAAKYSQDGVGISETQSPTGTQSQQQFWQQLRVPMGPSQRLTRNDTGTSMTGTEPNLGTLLNFKPELTGVSQSDKGNQAGNLELAPGQMSNRGPDVYDKMKVQFGKLATTAEGFIEETAKPTISPAEANEPTKPPVSSTANPVSYGGIYKSFAVYSDDKFNRHMLTAEQYMKQGRFYRAADAYTLATIYKPTDPLGYAGKSQALFAAGEYMSSALFLARTLEIFPEYAKVKIDLIAMIGDKDTVENRILEAREWADRSESAELEFLLSYIYYQMDRMEFSRQAIESAAKKMPNSRAVAAMKKAVDERLTK